MFEGVQNHAGTTRMAIRKDAGVALVHLASAIYQRFPEVAGPRTVWTTGRITLDPGAPSIVPGRAEMLFQFRDTDPALLATLDRELETLVAQATRGPCTVTIAERGQSVPQAMDAGFQDALERAAERHAPGLHVRMPSGAGHDAQVLAERMNRRRRSCLRSAQILASRSMEPSSGESRRSAPEFRRRRSQKAAPRGIENLEG